jgi:FlaG/FlaF family flagellin (archaellin)
MMRIALCVGILAAISAVTVPCGTAQSSPSQQGKIVSVQKQTVATPPVRAGADVDRAPLQSQYYLYNVSVQLNCEVYDLRYE